MLPTSEAPAAFEQARQHREHRRRVPAGRGRLAGRQADLALRHREAREAVHQQQHVVALVAERLGDAGRGERGAQAHQRGFVGGRDDDDRAGEAFGAEVVLDELADLTAALADEREHGDRRFGAAGDHREQRRLADAGTGEDAHALAAAARHERVEGAHAERQRFADHARGSAGAARRGRRRRVAGGAATGRRRSGGRARRARARAARGRRDRRWRRRRPRPGRRRARRAARRAACRPGRRWCTATTSAIDRRRPRRATRTDAPIGSCRPSTSRLSPTTRATRPCTRGRAASSTCSSSACSRTSTSRAALDRGADAGVDAARARRRRCSRRA